MSQSIRPATGGKIIGGSTTPVVLTERQRRIDEHTLRGLEEAHGELETAIIAIRGTDGFKARTPAQEAEAEEKSLDKLRIKQHIEALRKKLGNTQPTSAHAQP